MLPDLIAARPALHGRVVLGVALTGALVGALAIAVRETTSVVLSVLPTLLGGLLVMGFGRRAVRPFAGAPQGRSRAAAHFAIGGVGAWALFLLLLWGLRGTLPRPPVLALTGVALAAVAAALGAGLHALYSGMLPASQRPDGAV